MPAEPVKPVSRPTHYVCPSCRLYLLSWDPPSRTIDMFHKVGLWSDFWTGHVRMICQYCLGATDVLPDELVVLLRQRLGLGEHRPERHRAQG
jgi:hypothetical protein